MNRQPNNQWKAVVVAGLLAVAAVAVGTACTPEQANAVLAGIQVTADQLSNNSNDNVSFGDWLSSELNH